MIGTIERIMVGAIAVSTSMMAVRFLGWEPREVQVVALVVGGTALVSWFAIKAVKKTPANG